jgi:hypothetical protein
MIRVTFQEPATKEWQDWKQRGEVAAKEMLDKHAQHATFKVKISLYKEQRAIIFEAFHGKCAYCEAKVILDQTGDVEHFRPKGRITDEEDKVIEIDGGAGQMLPHPGYFWLAYDWPNLLPSCARCNRPFRYDNGRRVGKWNRFPVVGHHAVNPAGVVVEKPLLLNPMSENPSDHLEFDKTTGRIIGRTTEGGKCVDIFDLNREGLPEARRDVYDAVLARGAEAKEARKQHDASQLDKHLGFLLRHKRGEAEYSIAGRRALADHQAAVKAELQALEAQLDALD